MDYEKKYKEAQKWIESIYSELSHEQQMEAEAFFPELKESEDERIRKEILQSIRDNMVVIHKDKCIAWLENQGESNPYSGVSFKYNGHTWGMCARDNGVDILLDKQLFKHLEKQDKQKIPVVDFKAEDWYVSKVDGKIHNAKFMESSEKQGEQVEINPSEFDLRLNRLLKQFESLSKEELANSLSFYLNVVQNDGTYVEEKQGEQKPSLRERYNKIKDSEWFKKTHEGMSISDDEKVDDANYCSDCINKKGCINCVDGNMKETEHKIKPKFHEGDWITCEELNTALIVNIVDDKYEVEFVDGNKGFPHIDYVDRLFHLWTIKDAKDGDVLQLGNVTAIFQEYIGSGNCKCYCSVYNGEFEIPSQDNSYGCHNAIPATKEQRDTLFAKMKEAGYTWNADKKQLKKIEQKPAEEYSFNIESELFHQLTKEQQELWKKEIEQAYNAGVEASDEWSEEDEKYIKDLTDYFIGGMSLKHTEENIIAWIKSLGHQQKQEWSEEDEEYLRRAINAVKNTYPMTANWLKSLKERYTWKPSDAQMGALLSKLPAIKGSGYEIQCVLETLYDDLKKLKGE